MLLLWTHENVTIVLKVWWTLEDFDFPTFCKLHLLVSSLSHTLLPSRIARSFYKTSNILIVDSSRTMWEKTSYVATLKEQFFKKHSASNIQLERVHDGCASTLPSYILKCEVTHFLHLFSLYWLYTSSKNPSNLNEPSKLMRNTLRCGCMWQWLKVNTTRAAAIILNQKLLSVCAEHLVLWCLHLWEDAYRKPIGSL